MLCVKGKRLLLGSAQIPRISYLFNRLRSSLEKMEIVLIAVPAVVLC
jgi:hypothetical protein